jgi:hypothetical protein
MFLLTVPKVCTDLGKRAFSYAAPFLSNESQGELKLGEMDALNRFKALLDDFVLYMFCLMMF